MESYADSKQNYKHGDYISGLSVQENAAKIFEQMTKSVDRRILALEMEASAFLNLCVHTDVMSLGVVKGVSDLGDENKLRDGAIYRATLKTTAKAIVDWLETILVSMDWELNESKELGARLAHGYYEHFVRLVADAISQGYPLDALSEGPPLGEAKCLKIIMPEKLNSELYAEQGQIHSIARQFGLREVATGRGSHRRTLYCKDQYLIDFPKTLGTLLAVDESTYQALVFDKTLKSQHYCKASNNRYGAALAEVLSWEEFESLSQPQE